MPAVVRVNQTSNVALAVNFSRQTIPRNLTSVVIPAVATTALFFLSVTVMASIASDVKNMKKLTVFPLFAQNFAKDFPTLVIEKAAAFLDT